MIKHLKGEDQPAKRQQGGFHPDSVWKVEAPEVCCVYDHLANSWAYSYLYLDAVGCAQSISHVQLFATP